MLCTRQNAGPGTSGYHSSELDLCERLCFFFQRFWRIYDVAELILGNASIVVELCLMAESFESLHVHVEVEISRYHRNVAKYLETLEWKRFEFVIQNKNETLNARSWQRQVALIGCELSFSCSSFSSLCWRLSLFVFFLWVLFACFGWCSLSCSLTFLF